MRLTAYVILMFSISAILYMMGFRAPGLMSGDGQPLTLSGILTNLVEHAFNPDNSNGLIALGATFAAAAITTYFAGFAAVYIIPLILLFLTLNYFVFPTSFLWAPSCSGCVSLIPSAIALPIFILLNILLVLTMLNFIRGSS